MTERQSRGLFVQRGKGVVGTFPLPPGTKDATLPPPPTPAGVTPLHETPTPDGLSVDRSIESYAFKRWSPTRWSPFRDRWSDVYAFDAKVTRLEDRQTDMTAELVSLREQFRLAENAYRDELARWVADASGTRPLPTTPGLEEQISERENELTALETAMRTVLDEKAEYVVKHSGRLRREAAKARRDAVAALNKHIDQTAAARSEVVACVEAERWASTFPGPEADAGSLRLSMIGGGRVVKAIPELNGGQLAAVQVLETLRADSAWLDNVAAGGESELAEADPHSEAIWETSPEGRKAIGLANSRLRQIVQPRNVHRAGWED